MEITFTLNSLYTGATYVAGPFDISGTTCDGSTYWLVTGATKAQLATGVTINTIYDNISGGTITSGGECAGTTQAWLTGIECEEAPSGSCYSYTYNSSDDITGISVRWRNISSGNVDTVALSGLESMDNGDGTLTVYLCVQQGSSYASPVFVQGGLEVVFGSGFVSTLVECTSNSTCALN
jgi:hypothetical protein